MDLLESWSKWESASKPFILGSDREVMNSIRSKNASVIYEDWEDVIQHHDFGDPGGKLHLGLLPQPFLGNIRSASVYLLMLNPGLSMSDYFGELKIPDFRSALEANLKQTNMDNHYPFICLNPKFSWHSGFDWWHGKLKEVIKELARKKNISFGDASKFLASEIASIELMPYHSASFNDKGKWLKDLTSVKLVREFVKGFVMERVERKQAIVVVTRSVDEWDLPDVQGVLKYTKGQSRKAGLSLKTNGGQAILTHLLQRGH